MKKVLILFGKSNWKKSRPFENRDYQYFYEYFYTLCKKNGIQMYRASYEWYDYKKNIFKYAWIYEGENVKWKRVFNIKPDLIYDKTVARLEVYYKKELISKKYRLINNREFTQIIDDKLIISLIFKNWSKKSWLINNKNELKNLVSQIKTNKIVLKPLLGSGGKGIKILNKKNLLQKAVIDQVYLAQEFIESSRGIPGVSKGRHDLRLVMVNEKIVYAYIREPHEGGYLANLAQGGTLTIVPLPKLPKSVMPIILHANEIFKIFEPRIYSIDFMFDKKKRPWVIELNSMPGLYFTPSEKPSMIKMYKELLLVFKKKLETQP